MQAYESHPQTERHDSGREKAKDPSQNDERNAHCQSHVLKSVQSDTTSSFRGSKDASCSIPRVVADLQCIHVGNQELKCQIPSGSERQGLADLYRLSFLPMARRRDLFPAAPDASGASSLAWMSEVGEARFLLHLVALSRKKDEQHLAHVFLGAVRFLKQQPRELNLNLRERHVK